MIGTTIAHYRITADLGAGGMGVVFRADDLKLGRPVALKFLSGTLAQDRVVHERFLREARAAAALNHPGICTIYEINDSGPRPFLAMELLEGQSLYQLLAAGTPLPVEQVLELGAQVAEALEAAHEKGLVHRDVKPGNIFLTSDGRAKVVDFGLAKAVEPSADSSQSAIETKLGDRDTATRSGTTLGTVAYMSPEQARGERVDGRSDIFALGLVLYEVATGRRAFEGTTAAVIFDGILNRMPVAPRVLRPTLPAEFERILGRTLDKDPDRRYQRAAELAADLRRLQRASDPAVLPAGQVAETSSSGAAVPWGTTPATPFAAAGAAAIRRRRRAVFALAALGVVTVIGGVLLVAGVLGWPFGRADALTAGDPVIVTDFDNKTGDADFDGTLREALGIKLEESPHVNVVSMQQMQEMLRLMARQADEPVTRDVGLEMCQRMGVPAIMTGEIVRLGSSYVLTVAAESCATGEPLAREQVEARRKEEVLGALGTATSTLRGRLGESLASIQRLDQPLAKATTPWLAALRSFALGDRKRAEGREVEAIPFYRRAVELDPQFALAYGRLGTVYGNMGEWERARETYRKAFELRDRASERERLYITAHYNSRVLSDPVSAREVYEVWRQTYPHDHVPVHNLGTIYMDEGDYEKALEAFREAGRLEPHNRLARDNTAGLLITLGRFDKARVEVERQVADLGASPRTHLMLYQLDWVGGNPDGMTEHALELKSTAYNVDRLRMDHAIALFEGRFRDARALLATLVDQAERSSFSERILGAQAAQIASEAIAGDWTRTRDEVARLARRPAIGRESLPLAFALALAGDPAGARRLFDLAARNTGQLTEMNEAVRPVFEATLLLQAGKPAAALTALEPARSWEGRTGTGLLVASLRGEAHLALEQGQEAEAAFATVVAHRGLDLFGSDYVVAHLGLARARALAGNIAGARDGYEAFFRLWKDADPDLPLLEQARAEYAKLPPA